MDRDQQRVDTQTCVCVGPASRQPLDHQQNKVFTFWPRFYPLMLHSCVRCQPVVADAGTFSNGHRVTSSGQVVQLHGDRGSHATYFERTLSLPLQRNISRFHLTSVLKKNKTKQNTYLCCLRESVVLPFK